MIKQALLSVAVMAVLATIALPVAQAAREAAPTPTTAGNLKLVGYSAYLYASDHDGQTVLSQSGEAGATWSLLLQPYGKLGQAAFFDPARGVLTQPTASVQGTRVAWSEVTSLSINDSGYSGRSVTLGGKCGGRRVGYLYGQRSVYAMDPARVAFAPTIYPGTTVGWKFFHSYEAPFPTASVAGVFPWRNLVFATKGLYSEGKIPVARADGSLGSLTVADFKPDATAVAAQCSYLTGDGGKVWGRYWLAD